MSGLIVGLVLRTPITETFSTEAKFIATVYADHAWEDGSHAYPAVDTVAGITGLSDRTVQRYLRVLESIGMLILDGKGPRGTNKYKFPLESGQDGSVRLSLRGGDTQSPRQADGGDTESGDTESGDTCVTQTNNPSLTTTTTMGAGEIFRMYESEIGILTPIIRDSLNEWIDDKAFPNQWIIDAIRKAVVANARNWNYVVTVLKAWKAKGSQDTKIAGGKYATGNQSNIAKGAGRAVEQNAPTDADRAAAERILKRRAEQVS